MNTFTGMDDLPSIAQVDRIATLGDAVLRNLQITQCYHELALAVATRTHPSANWCTFATWASKQAGQTIRKQDLIRALEHLLTTRPATMQAATNVATATQEIGAQRNPEEIRQKVWEALNPMSAIDRASDAVARGNLKVFAEIGREFARFASTCLNDQTFDADQIASFCAELRPGDPPDGQRLLRQAFTRYYQAFFESDPQTRAELMLLANLEIGLHEQTRLQPEIAEALEASLVTPDRFARRLLQALFSYRGWLLYVVLLLRRLLNRPMPLDLAIQQLLADARHQVRSLITEQMMVLVLPHGVWLRLGEDLRAEFPAVLRRLVNLDLLALLKRIDPTPDSLRETGAVDWADLPERIHFIADLFRCYAESANLFEPPFSPDQITAIKAGQLPNGSL